MVIPIPPLSFSGGDAGPSGARADSSQAGVSAPFAAFVLNGGGNFKNYNSSVAGYQQSVPPITNVAGPAKPSLMSDPFNLILLALGGVGLWLLLKK